MIPILLKPKVLSIKNRWRSASNTKQQIGRDLVLSSFSIAVMWAIYRGMLWSLLKLREDFSLAYLHPSTIFGIICVTLFSLMLFSSAASALGALFSSHDLDLILSAPISRVRFFTNKLLEVLFSSGWMVVVFGLPILAAFATAYHARWDGLLFGSLLLIPFLIIPAALSITIVTIFTSIVPVHRTKELLMLAGALGILGVYYLARLIMPTSMQNLNNIDQYLQLLQILQAPNRPYMPSYWYAVVIGEYFESSNKNIWPYLLALIALSVALSALAFISLRLLHQRSYSMARVSNYVTRVNSSLFRSIVTTLTFFASPHQRAILIKDTSVFLRDMAQAVQLLLLLGLCTIYLYNLRVLRVVEDLPAETRAWWQSFLIIGNMAMGAFVIAAVCTRFVFTSISLEGKAFWVLRASPISLKSFLKAKFWSWFVPISIVGSILLGSGALAINAEPHIVIMSSLSSWLMCYGIVGLAVGLGAVYANFDWEHPSQLAASFGSLIFMASSTMLIAINMLPLIGLTSLSTIKEQNLSMANLEWNLFVLSTILLIGYLNHLAMRWALKLGEKALWEREC